MTRRASATLSELQQRKLGHMFDVYDADKNGYLEESDFAQVGQRLDRVLHLNQDLASNWWMTSSRAWIQTMTARSV